VDITDPHADPVEVERSYGFKLVPEPGNDYDAVVVAVNHREFTDLTPGYFRDIMNGAPILFDIKSIYDHAGMEDIEYWRL
jgi:UDP-N-acetyl-D-galactosamine dehydrogenase